jgi:NTP pyrophosphatase (non-canonical NTP hydrolase)
MQISQLSDLVELVSQRYAEKYGIDRDKNWFVLKLQEEMGELIQSYLMMIGQARDKGKAQEEIEAEFKKEVADVFCHTLLLAKHFDVDLIEMIDEKWLSRIK